MSLKNLKDSLAKNLYNMTKDKAINKNICIQCRNIAKTRIYSAAGKKEYLISGLCEECFDEICRES